MVTFVALAMAEVCSAYPDRRARSTGGPRRWPNATRPRGPGSSAGSTSSARWPVTAAIDFGAAITTSAFLSLTFDMEVTKDRTFLIFLVIIIVHGCSTRSASTSSAALRRQRLVAPGRRGVIVVLLAVRADQHKPISEVFFEVHNATGFTFAGASVYAVLIGC
jgi:hypothetical protein